MTQKPEEELKPCPFCEGEAVLIEHPTETASRLRGAPQFQVKCTDCRSQTNMWALARYAIAAWNRRASPSPEGTRERGEYRITADATNLNCLRIHQGRAQLCKVYGWSPEDTSEKAARIVKALTLPPVPGDRELENPDRITLLQALEILREINALEPMELNPSNYDHDLVCELNRNAVYVASMVHDFLKRVEPVDAMTFVEEINWQPVVPVRLKRGGHV